jgi:hypothetical protein
MDREGLPTELQVAGDARGPAPDATSSLQGAVTWEVDSCPTGGTEPAP